MARKKKVTKKTNGALAGILAEGRVGFEDAGAGDYAIPMLRVLQKLSPQVDKSEPEYVEGAEPGMIYHSIRNTVYEAVTVLPCKYRKVWLEWVLRENGGGFRGENGPAVARELLRDCVANDKRQMIMPNGNHLAETANYYVMFEFAPDMWEPVMISMSSSQLKVAKLWLSQLGSATYESAGAVHADLPMDFYQWEISTQELSNDKGKWYGWVVEQGADTLELLDLRSQSKGFRTAIAQEQITYNPEQEHTDNSL